MRRRTLSIVERTLSDTELQEKFTELKRLVEASRVEQARAFMRELVKLRPHHSRVRYWAKVLAPPAIVLGEPRPSERAYDEDYIWVAQHWDEYPGQFLATYGNRLIAADRSGKRVEETVRATLDTTRATVLIHYVRASGE
jgi:hypothetical protein